MLKTMRYESLHEVYVWGKNASSEIGLTDEIIKANPTDYKKEKGFLFKPTQHKNFEKMCLQASCGNVNSTFLCVDQSDQTFVITCGITLVTAEGNEEITESEIDVKDSDKVDQIPSLPYMVDFKLPVCKVMCGSVFSGLLTNCGQVYTWGDNQFGQLGVKNQ